MERIIDAHRILDRALRRMRLGALVYKNAEGRLDGAEQVRQLALDGLHQIGLTRMAAHASAGVVDPNCRIFEFQNLFVAGSSTFPTSGRAPPTLPAIALAVRLSEHIAARYRVNLRNPLLNITSHAW
jgi:choline dehydrogenase-like flavoprotein